MTIFLIGCFMAGIETSALTYIMTIPIFIHLSFYLIQHILTNCNGKKEEGL